MTPEKPPNDYWRWPALLLWLIFFILGLWPELSFDLLRSAGYVFSQNAVINSYNFITWSLTGFLAYFVYHRCIEADMPPLEALGKALQLGVLAFVAFVDLPLEHIGEIRHPGDRALVLGTVGLKLLVWLYLCVLIVRYYIARSPLIIARALPYFALTLAPGEREADRAEPDEERRSEERASVENPAD